MGTYATVQDLRNEGITPAQADDSRLEMLLEEGSRMIDHFAGWWFEPRFKILRLDGRGTPTIELPVPPIKLQHLVAGGKLVSREEGDLLITGAPVEPGFDAPAITLLGGAVFPIGRANVEATGWWGFTEENGSEEGRTPVEIRRVCMLLALRWLPLMGRIDDMADALNRWRIIEERTRDQSYKLDRLHEAAPFTGDPEIDRILMRYKRPVWLGAA